MGKNRQIYQVHGLFVGPAPETGYHFINNSGVLNNDYQNVTSNHNLIQPILRVQQVSYNLNAERTEVKQLGKRGVVARPIISFPTINISFDYLQMGLINEARMGFYVNYAKYSDSGIGEPFYSDNFSVGLLSGFVTKSLKRESNDLQWPHAYRDKRNLFVAVGKEGFDLNKGYYTGQDTDVQNVIGFGNCYLTSYRARATIGDFPRCSVEYIAENMTVQTSGRGQPVPALNTRTRAPVTGIYYNLPSNFQASTNNRVLLPGDILIDINSTSAFSGIDVIYGTGTAGTTNSINDIVDLGVHLGDAKIQSYEIDLSLPRASLNSIAHKLPLDRPINFPVYANLDFSMVVGDDKTGSLYNLLHQDDEYNVAVKLNNPFSAYRRGTAIQYDFRRAKFAGMSFGNAIGTNKVANFNFSVEVDPSDFKRGLFISGLLNVDGFLNVPLGFLLVSHPSGAASGDGGYLLQENGDKIITKQFTLLY